MRVLRGEEEKAALVYLNESARTALESTCLRSKCGSIIVNKSEIIGKGFNSPPGDLESQRRCSLDKSSLHKKITDKTCCVHAEQRAISDALRKNPHKIENSRLYFIRLDKSNEMEKAGDPYCTICSKFALDVGISEFVLLREEGIYVYNTDEYNKISFEYKDNLSK